MAFTSVTTNVAILNPKGEHASPVIVSRVSLLLVFCSYILKIHNFESVMFVYCCCFFL